MRTLILISLFALAACTPPKPLTADEQLFLYAKNECLEQTSVMLGDSGPASYSSIFQSLSMTSYFQWCMKEKGYSDEVVEAIWF